VIPETPVMVYRVQQHKPWWRFWLRRWQAELDTSQHDWPRSYRIPNAVRGHFRWIAEVRGRRMLARWLAEEFAPVEAAPEEVNP
jgi:hypothetical protein